MDAREYLFRRKNRMVGKLLDYCEREVFSHLNEDQRESLRAEIKRKVGDYHRDALDLLDDGSIKVNAIAVEVRDRMHDHHRPHT